MQKSSAIQKISVILSSEIIEEFFGFIVFIHYKGTKNSANYQIFNELNFIELTLTYKIRGAIFKVYNELGPGLLESVYEAALLYQLREDGLQVESQKKLDVYYDGHLLPVDFRLDIIVEDKVIIELKSVELLKDVHRKQLLTYLKISGKKVGLLVNFNTTDLSKDIVRIVNGL